MKSFQAGLMVPLLGDTRSSSSSPSSVDEYPTSLPLIIMLRSIASPMAVQRWSESARVREGVKTAGILIGSNSEYGYAYSGQAWLMRYRLGFRTRPPIKQTGLGSGLACDTQRKETGPTKAITWSSTSNSVCNLFNSSCLPIEVVLVANAAIE
jgi:hypothetical protein